MKKFNTNAWMKKWCVILFLVTRDQKQLTKKLSNKNKEIFYDLKKNYSVFNFVLHNCKILWTNRKFWFSIAKVVCLKWYSCHSLQQLWLSMSSAENTRTRYLFNPIVEKYWWPLSNLIRRLEHIDNFYQSVGEQQRVSSKLRLLSICSRKKINNGDES